MWIISVSLEIIEGKCFKNKIVNMPFQVFPLLLCLNQILAEPDPAKVKKILIVPPPKQQQQQNASAKHDYEEFGTFAKRDGYPPKVIQVTKTIAVQIPIPVPNGAFQQHQQQQQQNQASKQSQIYLQQSPVQIQQKRMTTPKPATPMKINSPEMHAAKNSIWQQNFPPNPTPKRFKSTTTTPAPELAPTAGSITISQNAMTKAVTIEIPWNAAMKEGFLDELSKNPNPLLFSLNLLPSQSSDISSYGAPPAGVPQNFGNGAPPSGYDSSTQSFYPETSGPSSGQVQYSQSQSPASNSMTSSFNEYITSQQFGSDGFPSGLNSTHLFRYLEKKPHGISYGGNDVYEHRPAKPRHRKPQKPIEVGKYHSQSSSSSGGNGYGHDTNLFMHNFEVSQDASFANSDIQAALREYEKRVEKDLNYERADPSGSDSDTSYSMETSVITAMPRTTRLRHSKPQSIPINTTFRPKRKKKITKLTITKAV